MTARTGRPPVGPQVKVRLPAELLAAVDAAAVERGVTRSEMVRLVLLDWWASQ